jgi:transposase, IS5 family
MTTTRSTIMKQLGLSMNLSTKKGRKAKLLEEMERVMPRSALVAIVEPYCPRAKTGRPPFAAETMLRIHCLHRWFCLSAAGYGAGAARHATIPRVRLDRGKA